MRTSNTMTFGTSTFLVAIGAILRYAVTMTGEGFDIDMIGAILMIAGLAGFVISIAMLMAAPRNDVATGTASDATVVETTTVRER